MFTDLGKNQAFIIAEISANHQQDLNTALSLIKKAKECGADAVKFQCYTPDTLTIDVKNSFFRVKHAKWGGQTLYQLYQKAYTPWGWFKRLKKAADGLGLCFFATAFDKTSVDFLEGLKVPLHKIASFELVDLPLIRYVARTRKPVILSTGMATFAEIKEAVCAVKNSGARELALLKCVSSYPALAKNIHLRTIVDMRKRFRCKVGLSDHTLGFTVSVAAVCLGARIIEKHFTLSRKIDSPDSFFSLEPGEFKELVRCVRIAEEAIGRVAYGPRPEEKTSLAFRRSIFAVKDIKKGDLLTEGNVRSIRPSAGIRPKYYEDILGRQARADIKKGAPLKWDKVR